MLPSAMLLRRFLCCGGSSCGNAARVAPAAAVAADATREKRRLVFMGSPQVSALVLEKLFNASEAQDSVFELAAIITQPPSGRERGRKVLPSPVAQYALDRGFPHDLIFTPERAGEESFLVDFKALIPELCVTAAYGNILPSKFLEIPQCGTVNIHPSLLPLYRGAAPVQRALQDGVKETGVSLAYTVRALDAGPVLASERLEVDDHIKAPELLEILFNRGSELLIHEIPSIFDGSAKLKAQTQDDSKATLAPKLKPEESWLSFDEDALVLHNKVRAFSGWPATRAKVQVFSANNPPKIIEIKIITTRFLSSHNVEGDENDITLNRGALMIPCSGTSVLEVLEIQLPGKKVMTAHDFWNGLRGQKLKKLV
uniref:Methionyl-tRNA formyltransferase, mitochondrial n=1 Tax=Anthurium amnicola TaxID=1678845 RepID=A0A1D1XUR6_9ARAE